MAAVLGALELHHHQLPGVVDREQVDPAAAAGEVGVLLRHDQRCLSWRHPGEQHVEVLPQGGLQPTLQHPFTEVGRTGQVSQLLAAQFVQRHEVILRSAGSDGAGSARAGSRRLNRVLAIVWIRHDSRAGGVRGLLVPRW